MSEPVSAPAPPPQPTTVHNTWNEPGYVFVPLDDDSGWGHWVSIGGATQSQ